MGQADSNCLIQINGGYLVVDSVGDSIDSNGNVEVTGGVLLVSGPTSDGNGAFDYDGSATVSGGTVLMVGSAGMAKASPAVRRPSPWPRQAGRPARACAWSTAAAT